MPLQDTSRMDFDTSLQKNIEQLKKSLISQDISFSELKIGDKDGVVIFANDLVDKDVLGELVLRPALYYQGTPNAETLWKGFFCPEKQKIFEIKKGIDEVVFGNALLLCDDIDYAISFGIKQFEKRAITEPPTSTVIKGPREGFVESLPINVSLIRRRLKTPHLIFENMQAGKYSKTTV